MAAVALASGGIGVERDAVSEVAGVDARTIWQAGGTIVSFFGCLITIGTLLYKHAKTEGMICAKLDVFATQIDKVASGQAPTCVSHRLALEQMSRTLTDHSDVLRLHSDQLVRLQVHAENG
jgi:hypothetical protein